MRYAGKRGHNALQAIINATMGKITREAGEEVYYLLVSSKRSTYGDSSGAG